MLNLAIVSEVYSEMVVLRQRDIVRRDSARLSCAIREIARRHHVPYAVIEAYLDQALEFKPTK